MYYRRLKNTYSEVSIEGSGVGVYQSKAGGFKIASKNGLV